MSSEWWVVKCYYERLRRRDWKIVSGVTEERSAVASCPTTPRLRRAGQARNGEERHAVRASMIKRSVFWDVEFEARRFRWAQGSSRRGDGGGGCFLLATCGEVYVEGLS